MQQILMTVELVLGSLMALMILVQHRASGLSAAFGGTGVAYVQRRGAEKVLYQATIVLAVAFFGIGIVMMYM